MRSPMVVRWKKSSSATMVSSTAPTTKMSNGEMKSCVPPALRSTRENAAGKDLTWPPNNIGASASRKMSSPSVRITTLSAGRDSTGLTRSRSTPAPSTKPAASATTNASQ